MLGLSGLPSGSGPDRVLFDDGVAGVEGTTRERIDEMMSSTVEVPKAGEVVDVWVRSVSKQSGRYTVGLTPPTDEKEERVKVKEEIKAWVEVNEGAVVEGEVVGLGKNCCYVKVGGGVVGKAGGDKARGDKVDVKVVGVEGGDVVLEVQ